MKWSVLLSIALLSVGLSSVMPSALASDGLMNAEQQKNRNKVLGAGGVGVTMERNNQQPTAVEVDSSPNLAIKQVPVAPQIQAIVTYDANEKQLRYGNNIYNFVVVGSRTFTMGYTKEQGDDDETVELPIHKVSLFSYKMGATEVPQWLWVAVMGNNPSAHVGDDLPVESVSWDDCQLFLTRLSNMTGKQFMLPTEAQMELAMRDGKDTNTNKYGSNMSLDIMSWYADNSSGETHRVGTKTPNSIGLYDITGNVGEWCSDWYGLYDEKPQTRPTGPAEGTKKVYRSASYASSAQDCRTAKRFALEPDKSSPQVGFRIVTK